MSHKVVDQNSESNVSSGHVDYHRPDHHTDNLRVTKVLPLLTPNQIKEQYPLTQDSLRTVEDSREIIRNIIYGRDPRMLVVVGPCSIHDYDAAMEYARRLKKLSAEVSKSFYLVMRVYFEKPRTTVGWKGLINDPHLDDSCDVAYGLTLARKLLLELTGMGLPTATEFLDPIVPQYIAEMISWAAVGARTTESQTHREMSSGLSMPVGFKNGTDGNIQTAIDAMKSTCAPHRFLGIDQDGRTSIIQTAGNSDSHVVLRGGRQGPNYFPADVKDASARLAKAGFHPSVMIDCSHANANKDHARQPLVWQSAVEQSTQPESPVMGAMIESNLHEGNQSIPSEKSQLKYGVSVTDACINWETTEKMLRESASI
ncbi:MAG: 3-deoxy-7-phosphoheptulonate synthase [Verrucomicrobiota bacterium]|nr:3-deoxy-7-phosphoheptulonate synthase [Verrucomicrobiota bacterium]